MHKAHLMSSEDLISTSQRCRLHKRVFCTLPLTSWLIYIRKSTYTIIGDNTSCIYVWNYENRVNFNITILPLLSRKYTVLFNQSITGSLSPHTLLTHLACVRLPGFRSLSLHSTAGSCPAKKMTSFTDKNAPL